MDNGIMLAGVNQTVSCLLMLYPTGTTSLAVNTHNQH